MDSVKDEEVKEDHHRWRSNWAASAGCASTIERLCDAIVRIQVRNGSLSKLGRGFWKPHKNEENGSENGREMEERMEATPNNSDRFWKPHKNVENGSEIGKTRTTQKGSDSGRMTGREGLSRSRKDERRRKKLSQAEEG